MTAPHIVSRAVVEDWAQDGDGQSQEWLLHCPEARWFGVDEGLLQVWFVTRRGGDRWVAEMNRDTAARIADRDSLARRK